MIQIQQLSKRYGRLTVLDRIDVDFPRGAVTALVGPNGSGKTTLIKCILGLTHPTSGAITVDGTRVNGGWEYRKLIGYMPQIARFPDNLTVCDVLSLVRGVRGQSQRPASDFADIFGLNGDRKKRMSALSGGTRQKVAAMIAAMFDPPIYILDEPTAGLDPISSSAMKAFIRSRRQEGRTVLLTSHIISEIESLADRIVFLLDGRLLFNGTPEELKDRTHSGSLEAAIPTLMEEKTS
ncbi:MAG: ABC transporter ATP-binding protein [Candidatus Zixiibacteriota bacterium]